MVFMGVGFVNRGGGGGGESAHNAMKYPYEDPPAQKRSERETQEQSILAEESGRTIEGVKGVSILSFMILSSSMS